MFHKIISPFKEFGLFPGLIYIIDRFFGVFSSNLRLFCYELLVQPIPEKPLIPPNMTKQLEIQEIKHGDPEIDLMPARPDIKESRFNQNATCLGVYQGGKFIGYIWLCFHAYEEDEVRCTFIPSPENEAVFDYDLYIFPEYRMGLAFLGLWNGTNEFLRNRGIKYSFSRLTRFNLQSRRSHQHLGCKRVAQAVFLKIWQVEFMVATIFPYINLSLRKSGRARLKLRPDILLPETDT